MTESNGHLNYLPLLQGTDVTVTVPQSSVVQSLQRYCYHVTQCILTTIFLFCFCLTYSSQRLASVIMTRLAQSVGVFVQR